MTTFVGMEYVIGNAFIYSKEKYLTLESINNYAMQIKKYWDENDIDAIIVGEIENATYNFDNYFALHEKAHIVVLQPNITIENLRNRFMGYLPFDVIVSFVKVSQIFSKC
jgi:hypothetical protein